MLIQENLLLQRMVPDGDGGTQFLFQVNQYGVSAITRPQEDISLIHWEVDIIKYVDAKAVKFETCHSTKLAEKTLRFNNDKSLNEFLETAFDYFNELGMLENMVSK
jgi:hypothetical protein